MCPNRALQLRISLDEIEPVIWREVLLPSSYTLEELHDVIQIALGWEDCHLHQFSQGKKKFATTREDMRDYHATALEHAVTLGELLKRQGSRLEYLYDFGDSWRHTIERTGAEDVDLEGFVPRCLGGERAGPLEDSGGAWGYQDTVEGLADPDTTEIRGLSREEMEEWVGPDFDPERFDLEEVNARLRQWHEGAEDALDPEDCPYQPDEDVEPELWLELEEDEAFDLVLEYHELAGTALEEGRLHAHAGMQAAVETQLARDDPPAARRALARLRAQGLSRHDALHAVGSALLDSMQDALEHKRPFDEARYTAALDALTADAWRALAETDAPGEAGAARLAPVIPIERARMESGRKVGRNDPCPCGSGKKYKNCCLK